jgi:hypothetical protein
VPLLRGEPKTLGGVLRLIQRTGPLESSSEG